MDEIENYLERDLRVMELPSSEFDETRREQFRHGVARATRLRTARRTGMAAFVAATLGGVFLASPLTASSPASHTSIGTPDATASADIPVRPVAFTVSKNGDNSITFTAHDLVDANAATKALNDAGIAGRVLNANSNACAGGRNSNSSDGALLALTNIKDTNSVTFRRSGYLSNGAVLIVVGQKVKQHPGVWITAVVYGSEAKIPTCVESVGVIR
ncbi:hypothetical protein ACIBBG_33880 [Micromonospora chersina]|uniref:hypothetical protein n=1 Tax=Micromonospora chersina TaxID=47854 RepID=UPI0037B39A18